MIPRVLATALLLLCWAAQARAHEVRPAYLELVETAPETYAATWKQPTAGEVRIALSPVFPSSCTTTAGPELTAQQTSTVARWRMHCSGGLRNRIVEVAGLDRTLTSVIIRVSWTDGRTQSAVIRPESPRLKFNIRAQPGLPGYLVLGVGHILSGFDHVLFVVGIIFLATGFMRLFRAITAFTVAHSITLGASALGVVGLPQKSVEAAIALSIVVLGYEIVRASRGRVGLVFASPWLVAFGFGLLHGFGFASALSEIGLPQNAKLAALLLFNVGVECGQLAIVAIALPAALWVRRARPTLRRLAERSVGYAIGIAGAFWMIERIAAVL